MQLADRRGPRPFGRWWFTPATEREGSSPIPCQTQRGAPVRETAGRGESEPGPCCRAEWHESPGTRRATASRLLHGHGAPRRVRRRVARVCVIGAHAPLPGGGQSHGRPVASVGRIVVRAEREAPQFPRAGFEAVALQRADSGAREVDRCPPGSQGVVRSEELYGRGTATGLVASGSKFVYDGPPAYDEGPGAQVPGPSASLRLRHHPASDRIAQVSTESGEHSSYLVGVWRSCRRSDHSWIPYCVG